MKKSQVDAMDQSVSSTDSTLSAREANSPTSRRKNVLHTETCETRADEADEPSIEKKASPKRVAGKKTSKAKIKSVPEPVDSELVVDEPLPQAISTPADKLASSQNIQETIANPFPNESQFNVSDDTCPSSDRFFCSDEKFEKFFRDKFGEAVYDDFDDDFDEDFLPLDDMEFNEALDEVYDEVDDALDYPDDDLDPDSASSDDDDFDKFDSDENFIEDSDDDYQTL